MPTQRGVEGGGSGWSRRDWCFGGGGSLKVVVEVVVVLRYDSLNFREESLGGAAFGETSCEKVVMVGLKAGGEVGA